MFMNLEKTHETPEKAQNFIFAHAKTPRTQRDLVTDIFLFLSELSGYLSASLLAGCVRTSCLFNHNQQTVAEWLPARFFIVKETYIGNKYSLYKDFHCKPGRKNIFYNTK